MCWPSPFSVPHQPDALFSAKARSPPLPADTVRAVAASTNSNGWLFTATDLPRLMSVPDPRGPYRSPLLQFVWDWNVAPDKGALVSEIPVYGGDDPNLLPAIAVVVHAL